MRSQQVLLRTWTCLKNPNLHYSEISFLSLLRQPPLLAEGRNRILHCMTRWTNYHCHCMTERIIEPSAEGREVVAATSQVFPRAWSCPNHHPYLFSRIRPRRGYWQMGTTTRVWGKYCSESVVYYTSMHWDCRPYHWVMIKQQHNVNIRLRYVLTTVHIL